MDPIVPLPLADWWVACPADSSALALTAVEDGRVVYLPALPFTLTPDEQLLLSADLLDPGTKNISLDPRTNMAEGVRAHDARDAPLGLMMRRFADSALALVSKLLPDYTSTITPARVSYRPAEIDHRQLSPRKDDSRLHVDAFPSRPNHGNRILRVFSNINPHGRPRHWRIGEPFENCARHFLPDIRPPLPGAHALLRALRITRGQRTDYDHYMLRLHDHMKADNDYQANAPQHEFRFPPGSTWIAFSDQVVHAAMSGQYLLEQTLHLPVAAMRDPDKAPLRILERLKGCALV